jgi:hypothetical protein
MASRANLVIVDPSELLNMACSADSAGRWPGHTFDGLNAIKLCALLSLLKGGSPDATGENHTAVSVRRRQRSDDEHPGVSTVPPEDIAELAMTAAMEETELDRLAMDCGAAEAFSDWSEWEVSDLLRRIGDLAETAMLHEKCLVLRSGY